ncbi:agamous-like MADS-box protein AGL27 isoform X2 [Brassica napus]|uniref:agamous-like MADS-box protein AGL27 isoform X2 n=1 Tax=Brassica napus TaxID=3708 RepID=UPI000BBED7BA|nr:agamous-like MADS-box protein AGL27 isoform X2 [Brassica napus]
MLLMLITNPPAFQLNVCFKKKCMAKILKHYEVQHADKLKTLDLTEKTQNYLSLNELLETVQRKLEAANVDNISVESLISLEEQFKTALSLTRARKTELMMQLVKTLQEKEKLLREENKVLASQLAKIGKENEFLEAEDERAMLLEYSSGNNQPETLRLLK